MNLYIWVAFFTLAISYARNSYSAQRERHVVLLLYFVSGLLVWALAPVLSTEAGLFLSSAAPITGEYVAHLINLSGRKKVLEGLIGD